MSFSGALLESDTLDEQRLRHSLGRMIRKMRKERGMTMVVLGRSSQCSQSFLSKVESGGMIPSIPMLHRLARALGVSPSSLLGEGVQGVDGQKEATSGLPRSDRDHVASPDPARMLATTGP